MGFRFLAIAVCVLSSLLVVAQQDTQSPPDSQSSSASASAPEPKLDLTPGPNGKLSQEQMQQLLRVVADKDLENDKRQRDYTYIERDVQHNLDGKAQTKSTEIKTY